MAKLERTNISGGVPWEPLRGYSRAVRVGDTLYVSGTTATDRDGSVFAPGDSYEQSKYVILKIFKILEDAGFRPQDVVRTRLFVTDISQWERYARAHREFCRN
jgi:enamine deaminase RidA (YjgF/YER057c/UK114 family)